MTFDPLHFCIRVGSREMVVSIVFSIDVLGMTFDFVVRFFALIDCETTALAVLKWSREREAKKSDPPPVR